MKQTILQNTSKTLRKLINVLTFFVPIVVFSQNITLSGVISDFNDYPIPDVTVTVANKETKTDKNGKFQLEINEVDKDKEIYFNHFQYEPTSKQISALKNTNIRIKLALAESLRLKEVVFQKERKTDLNSIVIEAKDIDKSIGVSGGVEDVLKTLPYVNSNTELSSQYMVRGGNYDENLIYINGIETYRPFLVRSGQQEGMSIVNPQMTSMINFSAGGFEAKYGDKMSSVLDITYKRPKEFELTAEASLIGGKATVGYADKKNKFTALVGGRYRNTNLLLNTLDTDTDFNPIFQDLQSYITYKFNPKLDIAFTGNISQNTFDMIPKTRETDFGTLTNPIRLTVFYDGKEEDKFIAKNASLAVNYKPKKNLYLTANFYTYQGIEQEYFDITSAYLIQEVDPLSGNATSSIDAGRQRDHARNDLDFLLYGTQLRGKYEFNLNSNLEAGIKIQKEDIRDFQNEWQLVDNSGYSEPRPQNINDNLELNYHISNKQDIQSERILGFLQWNKKFFWNRSKILLNTGVRYQNWTFNNQSLVSPRVQFAIKPNWNKDFLFRFATGVYYQAPIYKEIRSLNGELNSDIKAQKSYHFIAGSDYEFKWKERPFKLTTELYYKSMDDLIPYYIDNVRIRYTGENNSKGRAYGIDTRLNGEFIEDVESWISLSYARSQENIDNQGWIYRPTDQRFRASLFFQDYMKFFPSMKVNLQLVYASGLPNGAPLFTNPYNYQSNLSSYKRVDIGFTKVFVDSNKKIKSKLFKNFKEVALGVEAFNVFNIKNTISNQWVRDVSSNISYAVPNRLTGRFFNVKLYFKF
ncbi:MAG: TonB-dependent receptor [Flavobacteriales bacterium]|nr:TonB-dependent receptor [Flavobacteriales bacterium]